MLLPVLLIIGLFAALVILKRRLFDDEPARAPIPIPDIESLKGEARDPATARAAGPAAAQPTAPPADRAIHKKCPTSGWRRNPGTRGAIPSV